MVFIDERMIYDKDGKKISDKIGDLSGLQTTNKQSLVNAINENASALAESMNVVGISVESFGAKKDGTDLAGTTQAIRNAVTNRISSNGIVRFPDGTFLFDNSTPLDIPSNTTIILSPNTLIQCTADNSFVLVNGKSNIKIIGGKFKGTGVSVGGKHGFYFQNCDGVVLDGGEVSESSQVGIKFLQCKNSIVRNSYAHHNPMYGMFDEEGINNTWIFNRSTYNGKNTQGTEVSDQGRGINLAKCTGCKVLYNWTEYNTEYGIRLYSELGYTLDQKDNLVQGNYARGNGSTISNRGMEFYIFNASGMNYRNKVIGNTARKTNTSVGAAMAIGGDYNMAHDNHIISELGNQTGEGISVAQGSHSSIKNNIIEGFATAITTGSTDKPMNCEFEGNKALSVGSFMGSLQGGGHSVKNNKAYHGGTGTSDLGMSTGNITSECFVENNYFEGFYRAIQMSDEEVTIRNNTSKNSTGTGLYKYGNLLTNTVLQNNHFDSTFPAYLKGIHTQKGGYTRRKGIFNAKPSGLTWDVGDSFENSSPTETGTAGSKYIIEGWTCTVTGTPGTWVDRRTLTGN